VLYLQHGAGEDETGDGQWWWHRRPCPRAGCSHRSSRSGRFRGRWSWGPRNSWRTWSWWARWSWWAGWSWPASL
jgi:hypothetical protein